nr:CBM_HP1_G0008060.mRNA.1.CDS.1 [Saccharomyces cerevisiae]
MDSIVNVVEDDVKYAQSDYGFSSPQNANVRSSPFSRHSFTAFRLSYVSPTELSACSQVTLLGIPKTMVR